jgi:DNA-binding MarR family transcriptional regulator
MGTAGGWTFLTNHAHVLLTVRRDPHARLREIADAVGVTERAVQLILGDLEGAGYLRRTRVGRRNEYVVLGGPLRHPLERGRAVDDLLDALAAGPDSPADGAVDDQVAPCARATAPRRGGREPAP